MKYEEQYFKVVARYISVAQMHFAILSGNISSQDFSGWEKLMMMLLKNFLEHHSWLGNNFLLSIDPKYVNNALIKNS